MNTKTLSAVIEKKIKSLCLFDFPCGKGPWRKEFAGKAELESTDVLLDFLKCPHSPWWQDDLSWSPQASELRQLAVLEPERLNTNFIYNYFTALHLRGQNISSVDAGLLKFARLEELVLSVNQISEIPSENIPCTLKILELRANRVSSLCGLTKNPPPQLQYLGLASNMLGSHQDAFHLTGRHWPKLVCLEISDCNFNNQWSLLEAVQTLPCLRNLVLEGNPFTLAPGYPGLTVDCLPQLTCLDGSWISQEERCHFRGLIELRAMIEDVASVTINLGKLRGIPEPSTGVDKKSPEFPIVTYRYLITYQFLRHHTSDEETEGGPKLDAESSAPHTEGDTSESSKTTRKEDTSTISQHSTSTLTWSECADFTYSQTLIITYLVNLKKFLNEGLNLRLEEEKSLSWTAEKGKKGKKDAQAKSPSKDKPKAKRKTSVSDVVPDPPTRRTLASTHVPLENLVHGRPQVSVLCDFGPVHVESQLDAAQTPQNDAGKKTKGVKKKESEDRKHKGNSKETKMDDADATADPSAPVQLESVTVELCVELEKWKSASEARHLITPDSAVLKHERHT